MAAPSTRRRKAAGGHPSLAACAPRQTFVNLRLAVGAGADNGGPSAPADEFDAFLECGILAHGFLRLRCGDCGHDKLVAFGCKRRGFCPSCGARRMAQIAANLVDHVIPHVPMRQWVLSLPSPLRLPLASQPTLLTPVLQVVHRVLTRFLIERGRLKSSEADSGAVTLIQRFGSAANIHLHCLVLDGVYRCGDDGVPVFIEVDAPADDELHALLQTLITRLMKLLSDDALDLCDLLQPGPQLGCGQIGLRTTAPTVILMIGFVLAVLFVMSIGGWLYPLDIPPEFMATYLPNLQ